MHFGLKSQASLAKRHCSNNMVPTTKILKTVVIRVGVVGLGGCGSGMQVGHRSAWRLEQPTISDHVFHQCWTNTSFTRARDNSFVHQDSIVSIVSCRTSHRHLWCKIFFCLAHAPPSQPDWCVSAPHVRQLWQPAAFSNRRKMPTEGLFSETQLQKGAKSYGEKMRRNCGRVFSDTGTTLLPWIPSQALRVFPHLLTPTSPSPPFSSSFFTS